MLSAKSEYACLALARLAVESAGGAPVQGRRLAAEEGIPEGFLVQILQELKRAGLVTSTRGALGGYRLARDPSSISLGEVLDAVEGSVASGGNFVSPSPLCEALRDACADAARAARRTLDGVTLADLARRVETSAAWTFSI